MTPPRTVETVAERAVRGALAGYIYCERETLSLCHQTTRGRMRKGVYAHVLLFIPAKSIGTLLKREQKSPAVRGKKKGASR